MAASETDRGVLFDVGHTLMDESARLDAALRWVAGRLPALGLAADLEAIRRRYAAACEHPRPGLTSLIVQALLEMGLEEDAAWRLRRRLPWDRVPLAPYPDAVEALRMLKGAGFRTGVLANQPRSTRGILDRAGLLEKLDDVWLSEEVGLAKPDPAFFALALRAWGLPPDRVAYVGDRPDNDIAPARRVGIYTVRLLCGPHARQRPDGESQQAHASARTLLEAARHLLRWRSGAAP